MHSPTIASHRCMLGVIGLPLALLLAASPAHAAFDRETVDESVAAWGKGLLDVDADGLLDAIVGGGALGGNVFWYRAPDWDRFQIATSGGGDDIAHHDMNGDGVEDVIVNRNPIAWYENPRGSGNDPTQAWTQHIIDSGERSHDIRVHDFDGDGRPDVSARSAGGSTRIYFQEEDGDFTEVTLTESLRAEGGHAHADIDGNGRVDILGPGYWLEHPSDARDGAAWARRTIDASWPSGGSVDSGDIDHDGDLDVVLAPSETGAGTTTWYEAPDDPVSEAWTAHPIDAGEEIHRIHLLDFDQDGELDIAFAEMHQSQTDRVGVYHNQGSGSGWDLEVIATAGSHNIAVDDVDGDGDLDILGANWQTSGSPDGGRLNLWRNRRDFVGAGTLNDWSFVEITSAKPGRAFGLAFGDLNGDGRRDVVAGRTWYRNPGPPLVDEWVATDLGGDLDGMLVLDVDENGQPDVIAQGPRGSNGVPIVWLAPDDSEASTFTQLTIGNIPADPADGRSQGYAAASLLGSSSRELIFASAGVHAFTIPGDPVLEDWTRTVVTSEAREEGIAVGDLDRDDDLDVVAIVAPAGTTIAWWENTGGANFVRHDLGQTSGIEADRLALEDVDWDGRLDVIVSETNLRSTGNSLFWFAQPEDPSQGSWTRTTIASDLGSLNSMDAEDLNGDGRPDVVTGEHKGDLDVVVWENVDGGASWTPYLIASDVESHLGAQLIDLNGDGARDIVNIGFDDPEFVRLWTMEIVPEPASTLSGVTTLAMLSLLRGHRRVRGCRWASPVQDRN